MLHRLSQSVFSTSDLSTYRHERFHRSPRQLGRAMIKNGRGVTIRALADEVFSIRIGATACTQQKAQKQFIGCFVFLASRDTAWQIRPANPFHNVSCSVRFLQKLATIRATQPPFRCFQPEPPPSPPLSLSLSPFSLFLVVGSPRCFFFVLSLSPLPLSSFSIFFSVLTSSSSSPHSLF